MIFLVRFLAIAFVLGLVCASPAMAQNVGGVFGPEVTPDSKAVEFRTAVSPRSDGRPGRIATRFHYQQTVTDNLRLRAIIQGQDTNTSGFDYDAVQFEAQYQFLEDEEAGFDSAFRFDVLLADDRPDLVSFNWTNDVKVSEKWSLRGLMLAQVQFGDLRNDGLFLQSRFSAAYRATSRYRLEVQLFNFWGTTDDFQDINDQNHSLGPAVGINIGKGWAVEASTLFGLTDAAPDADFRVFLVKSF